MLFGYTYYIFGIHKVCEPNVIAAEEELDTILMHPSGIDAQNNRLTMPRSDFCGRFNGGGKMDIKPLAFLDALAHDGFHERFCRAVIQYVRRYGFSKLHIDLDAVALPGTNARHIFGKLISLLIVGGHDLAQFFQAEAMIGHQVAHFAPAMFIESI